MKKGEVYKDTQNGKSYRITATNKEFIWIRWTSYDGTTRRGYSIKFARDHERLKRLTRF